jgi:hypothetical protein
MKYSFKERGLVSVLLTAMSYFVRALGQGSSTISIISNAVLVFTSFFYIYTIGSFFNLSIYPLLDRVTYDILFDYYVVTKHVDYILLVSGISLWVLFSVRSKLRFIVAASYSGIAIISALSNIGVFFDIVALISIPIALSLLAYNKLTQQKILNANAFNLNLFLNYVATTGITLGTVAIIISAARIFSISLEPIPLRNYGYEIFLLFSSFSHILIFLLVACVPLKFLIRGFRSGILKATHNIGTNLLIYSDRTESRIKVIGLLAFFMLLSVGISLIPHQPSLNKDGQQIGVDTIYYVEWMNALMDSDSIPEFLQQAFIIHSHGDRPLSLIFLFGIIKILNADPFSTIEHVPILLGPGLVIVMFFLIRELTSSDNTAFLGSFLTAISFHPLIGIYAGFYANWLALIVGYLSFLYLFKFLKKPTRQNMAIYSALLVLVLFVHVYTWTIVAIVTGVFLAIILKTNHHYHRRNVLLLLLVLLSSVVIDVARANMTGSFGGVVQDFTIGAAGLGLDKFTIRWDTLLGVTHVYLGGIFSNFIILVLALYWLFRSDMNNSVTIFLMIFLSTGIIPLFFGDTEIQARVLYNVPLEVPAAVALMHIIRKQPSQIILGVAACIWLVAVSVSVVSNFYLRLPS